MVATQLRMPFSFCWWNLLHDYQFMWCLNIRRYPAIKKKFIISYKAHHFQVFALSPESSGFEQRDGFARSNVSGLLAELQIKRHLRL